MERATSVSKFLTLRFLVFSLMDSAPVPSAPVRSCRTTGQRPSSSFNIPSSRHCRSMTHDSRASRLPCQSNCTCRRLPAPPCQPECRNKTHEAQRNLSADLCLYSMSLESELLEAALGESFR